MPGHVEWHGAEIEARLDGSMEKALMQAAEHLLEEANRTVPLLEGTLMRSGEASSDDKVGMVSYGTPYARRQHEHLEYRHSDGRRAKWLELTFSENMTRVQAWLAEKLRPALGG